jgi:uncharacterized protein (UPF0261 family)
MAEVVVAVLATLDSKGPETRFVRDILQNSGVRPWLVDLSLRPHHGKDADITGGRVAEAADMTWEKLAAANRTEAGEAMVRGGRKVLLEALAKGELAGVIGLGGANGTSMACSIMRALPPRFPKVMVSPVAATAAVQWYVAESDIAMFPSIGDISLNRIVGAVLNNAALATAAMASARGDAEARPPESRPLVGVSAFGTTQGCVDRVTRRLESAGREVIQFHASGPGGKALEALAGAKELAGVIDLTTHELTDHVVGGVYSAGHSRLRAAGQAALPQVVVPGAIDFANFWVGQVPQRFAGREFHQFNAQNILMRTNAEEFKTLGRLFADRLAGARGPFVVLIPTRGFSENTKRRTHDINGRPIGQWAQPQTDRVFIDTLRQHLTTGRIVELDLHINDEAFADACADAFFELSDI